MTQQLNLARAAQLVGVARSTLQRMIGAGELASFDGFISVDELRRAFPQAVLEDAGAFEKVTRIRTEAFAKRVRERMLPSQEVLAQRLFAQGQELADLRRFLSAYHLLVVEGERRVRDLAAARNDDVLQALADAMQAGLRRALGTEPAEAMDAMANMLNVISAQVTVRPSGRQFLLDGNDSILQAGLKAGLRFGYGCGSGNCGLCKARIVAGEVRQIQHADYTLSEMERQQGYTLLCTHTAVSDVVVETLEASGPQDIPQQDIVCSVRAVTDLGADTRLLHLQTPRSNRLRFLAGQSVTLGVATPDGDVQQAFALASCPCDERNLHIHVARSQDGPVTRLLSDGRLKASGAVNVRGPLGDFVIDAESTRPVIFVACDTGFGPVKSLIEHLIASEQAETFALYWLATAADGHYLANQCRAWEAAIDSFSFTGLSDESAAAGAVRAVEALKSRHDDLARFDCFVAGPAEFVEAARDALVGKGAAQSQLRTLVV